MPNTCCSSHQDFFANLPSAKAWFLAHVRQCVLEKNSMLFLENDPSDACFYIRSGSVRYFRAGESGKDAVFSVYYPGTLLGFEELVEGLPRQSAVQALSRTTVYVLSKEDFLKLWVENAEFHNYAVSIIIRGKFHMEGQLASSMTQNVRARLIDTLLYYGKSKDSSEVSTHPIRFSQTQLAVMIGSTQATVSGMLRQLQEAGLLSLAPKHIDILDLAALKEEMLQHCGESACL